MNIALFHMFMTFMMFMTFILLSASKLSKIESHCRLGGCPPHQSKTGIGGDPGWIGDFATPTTAKTALVGDPGIFENHL
jgi:hypothetical protein